jgi:biofilm PGA synthesis N-glycosyltransferase PgaC
MPQLSNRVVVLSWNTPTTSDRSACKIAAFLGAETKFISLTAAALWDGASLGKLVPRCSCLIVDAETLAKVADAVGEVSDLADVATHIFIFGFQPTDRHHAVLRALSAGGLVRVQPLADGYAEFRIAGSHREWCGPFSGLSFGGVDPSREQSFLQGTNTRQQDVIIQAGDEPFFVRVSNGSSQVFFLACGELADLDEKVRRDCRLLAWFSRLVPLMMFLRGALGNRIWHNDHPRACFIIDDPLLKDRYGFLQHGKLLEIMGQRRFSASIGFIPWNYRRSSKETAALVALNSGPLFLSIHGCDHTSGEFTGTDLKSLCGKAQLALERMQAHQSLYGVPFDDVMTFPQGLFSAEAVTALKTSGYMAAVNTDLFPSSKLETLALRDLIDVAVTAFDDFPIFGRRYPNDLAEFAFDLFMGKPAFAVEHHHYFRDGYAPLETFVEQLNRLEGRLEWTSLGTACSRASLTRLAEDGDLHVQFYTNRFSLTNTETHTQDYVLLLRRTPDGKLPLVSINGRKWVCERQGGQMKIRVSLDAGQTANIRVLPEGPHFIGTPWKGTKTHNAGVRIRRFLCEFRDNYVDTSRVLDAIKIASRSFRSAARLKTAQSNVLKTSHRRLLDKPAITNVVVPCQIGRQSFRETVPGKLPSFVLVTPAKNEAAFIEKTLRSVIAQTLLPLKWVIVSDGSNDGTDEVVRKIARDHNWIELVTLPTRAERNFAGKVDAFNAGRARLAGLDYDVIGNLDADVSFDEHYFSFLLQKLADDPELGLVGTPYIDPLNQPNDYRFVSREHVTGPCQLFRRECFEAIGGYLPVKRGAIDRIADISTRMRGWKTRTFTEKMYWHHRHTGTSRESLLMSMFRDGGKDYSVGTSPVWELCRTAYQMTKKPLFLGGLMLAFGYFWSLIRREERPVTREFVEFCRQEQMKRLKMFVVDRTQRSIRS